MTTNNDNNTNNSTTVMTSETFAKQALIALDKAEKVYGLASKSAICALLQANTDVSLNNGVTIASYYELETKLSKMTWRNTIFEQVFNFSDAKDVQVRHKNLVDSVLGIVTILIHEGYTLIASSNVKVLDMYSLANDRKIIFDTKNNNLYLPKFLAVNADKEGVNDPYALSLCNDIGFANRTAKKLLNITSSSNRVQANVSTLDANVDVDELKTTVHGANVVAQQQEQPSSSANERIHTLLKATNDVLKMRTLQEFSKSERKLLYSIAKTIIAQLDDDAKIALLSSMQDTTPQNAVAANANAA